MEIWRQAAIDDLKRYNSLHQSIINIKEEIADIDDRLSVSGYTISAVPVQGGSSKIEDKYNNSIVIKDRLQRTLEQNIKDYKRIKRTLDQMSEQEQKLLYYAYINRTSNYIKVIMDTFNIESAQAYRYVNNALNRYVLIRYGV